MAVQWTRAKKLIALGAAIVGFLAASVALANDSLSLHDRFSGSRPSSPPSAEPNPSIRSGSPATDSTVQTPRPVSPASSPCRSEKGGEIDCQLPHRYQIYEGKCSASGLVSWLGGRSDIDVARGAVRENAGGGCLLDLKATVVGSSEEGFEREDSSVFRKCADDRSQSVVACNRRHTLEYVAADVSGVASEKDCQLAADRYLGVGIDKRDGELRARAIKSKPAAGTSERCVIEVVGSQRLQQTVRGLGTGVLHWVD